MHRRAQQRHLQHGAGALPRQLKAEIEQRSCIERIEQDAVAALGGAMRNTQYRSRGRAQLIATSAAALENAVDHDRPALRRRAITAPAIIAISSPRCASTSSGAVALRWPRSSAPHACAPVPRRPALPCLPTQ